IESWVNVGAAVIESRKVPAAAQRGNARAKIRIPEATPRPDVIIELLVDAGRWGEAERIELGARLADVVDLGIGKPDHLRVRVLAEMLDARGPLRDADDLEIGEYEVALVARRDDIGEKG